MTAQNRVVVVELVDRLTRDGSTRAQLMGMRPGAAGDLAELASKGVNACPSCMARLHAVMMSLTPDDVHRVFGIQAQVVHPRPLVTPRVIKVGRASDLQAALEKLVLEEGALVRSVTPFHEAGELYAVVA
jgi:hypothetical protein